MIEDQEYPELEQLLFSRGHTSEEIVRIIRRLRRYEFVEELVLSAVRAYGLRTEAGQQEAEAWLLAALHAILQEDLESRLSGVDGEHAQRIEAVCQAIRAAPADPHRVPDLAGQVGSKAVH